MESKRSLPHSKQLAFFPYSKPDRSCPCTLLHFCNIHLNIILLSTPGFFQVVTYLQVFPLKPCMHLYSPHTCYMPCPSQSSWLNYPNDSKNSLPLFKRISQLLYTSRKEQSLFETHIELRNWSIWDSYREVFENHIELPNWSIWDSYRATKLKYLGLI